MGVASKKEQALALVNDRRLAEAMALYEEVCQLAPGDAEAWFRLGALNLQFSALAQAEACFRHVIKLQPSLAIAYYNLGRALELQGAIQGKAAEAIAVYRQLLQVRPDVEAYYNIGVIYIQQGKFEEALKTYQEAQRIEPDNPRLVAAQASIYEKLGLYDQAYDLVQPFLAAGKKTPELALVLSSLSSRLDCHQEAIDLLELLLAGGDGSSNYNSRIHMHFALGKLLDGIGEFDRAFGHYGAGNSLIRHAFDVDAYTRFVDDAIHTFNKDFIGQVPWAMKNSDRLIFVVGMPRSGTTLIEQILDSHPQVHGCGELGDIGNMAYKLASLLDSDEPYPRCLVSLDEQRCNGLAQRYIGRVRQLSGGADFTSDKMPLNFNHLGFISLLFPEAKIVHCTRDPLDTCLSCYFQNFGSANSGLGFTSDLTALGTYYRQYQRLMQHWKTVLDMPILDVRYEDMVANQEEVTRSLLDFCGLPWDQRCLKFYDSGRVASTPSYDQVREPIYRKSVQRWKHYERHLEPLKMAMLA